MVLLGSAFASESKENSANAKNLEKRGTIGTSVGDDHGSQYYAQNYGGHEYGNAQSGGYSSGKFLEFFAGAINL